jgi:glycerol-3-phosphate dehydrogenase
VRQVSSRWSAGRSRASGSSPIEIAKHIDVSPHAAARIAYRHGARAELVQARIKRSSRERAVVCSCEPVLEAEIRHAVAVEHARDLCDVARRTRLGLGACGGMRCAQRAAAIVADERELSPGAAHAMAARFLVERWRSRLPALGDAQLVQEELHLQHVLLGSGLAADALDAARGERS